MHCHIQVAHYYIEFLKTRFFDYAILNFFIFYGFTLYICRVFYCKIFKIFGLATKKYKTSLIIMKNFLCFSASNGKTWSPHRVELALWTHYVASELKPELLDGIPGSTENGNSHGATNGEATEPSDDSNQETVANGKDTAALDPAAIDENSTTTSFTEDSMDKPATPITAGDHAVVGASEDTNDSIITNDSSNNVTPRPTDSEDTEEDSQDAQEPPTKKSKK